MRAGQIFRIVAVEGPQVADLNVWNLGEPARALLGARARASSTSAHVTTFDRLWSCLPYLRPMLTITDDSVRYGRDEDGGGRHDLLGTRCDPYVHKLLNGEEFDLCCHRNLVRAVAPFHLTELDVHDVLNVFQVTGLTPEGPLLRQAQPGRQPGITRSSSPRSTCWPRSRCAPTAIFRWRCGGRSAGDPLATCRPLGVEIWQPAPELLAGWTPPQVSDYRGGHGLRSE